jgi:hypothetical protein
MDPTPTNTATSVVVAQEPPKDFPIKVAGYYIGRAHRWDVRTAKNGAPMVVIKFEVRVGNPPEYQEPKVLLEKNLVFGETTIQRSLETLVLLGFPEQENIGILYENGGGDILRKNEVELDIRWRIGGVDNGVAIPSQWQIEWVNPLGGVRMGQRVTQDEALAIGSRIQAYQQKLFGNKNGPAKGTIRFDQAPATANRGETKAPSEDDIPF